MTLTESVENIHKRLGSKEIIEPDVDSLCRRSKRRLNGESMFKAPRGERLEPRGGTKVNKKIQTKVKLFRVVVGNR